MASSSIFSKDYWQDWANNAFPTANGNTVQFGSASEVANQGLQQREDEAVSDFFDSSDYRIQKALQDDSITAQFWADELNRAFQQSSAREAMNFSANQAEIDRQWQERMSNTAYQRAVADMRSAGINPILAYTQGGAATTSGASASGVSASGGSSKLDTDQVSQMLQSFNSQSAAMSSAVISGLSLVLGVVAEKYLPGIKSLRKIGF